MVRGLLSYGAQYDYEPDDEPPVSYWLLQDAQRKTRTLHDCRYCGVEHPVGDVMQYRVEVCDGDFIHGYSCYLGCVTRQGRRL